MSYHGRFNYLYFVHPCISLLFSGRKGALDCKLHWYPKFYNALSYFILVLFLKFDWSKFSTNNLIYSRCNFDHYSPWRSTSIFRSLSYPLRSLVVSQGMVFEWQIRSTSYAKSNIQLRIYSTSLLQKKSELTIEK